jgi:hypothetical protein
MCEATAGVDGRSRRQESAASARTPDASVLRGRRAKRVSRGVEPSRALRRACTRELDAGRRRSASHIMRDARARLLSRPATQFRACLSSATRRLGRTASRAVRVHSEGADDTPAAMARRAMPDPRGTCADGGHQPSDVEARRAHWRDQPSTAHCRRRRTRHCRRGGAALHAPHSVESRSRDLPENAPPRSWPRRRQATRSRRNCSRTTAPMIRTPPKAVGSVSA